MHDSAVASVSPRSRQAASTSASIGSSLRAKRNSASDPASAASSASPRSSAPGVDEQVDVDLGLARADRRLDALAVAAGRRERLGDGGLGDAVEAEDAPRRRCRPGEQAAERLAREGGLPAASAARGGGPGRVTATHPSTWSTSAGAVPAMPATRAPSGMVACLRTPSAKSA